MDRSARRLPLLTLAVLAVAAVAWWIVAGGTRPVAPAAFDGADFEVIDPGFDDADPWLPAATDVTPTAGERTLSARQELGLRGRIVDAAGTPLAGAAVQWALFGADGRALRLRQAVVTGADGAFAFAGSAPTRPRLVVVARHERHASTVVERVLSATANGLDLDLGEVALAAGGTVSGRILDPAPAPVGGAELRLRPAAGNRLDRVRAWRELLPPARTDAAGRFRIAHVPAGSYRLEAWAAGLQRGGPSDTVTVIDGVVTELGDVALARGHRLTGLVVGPDGTPFAGADVRVQNAASAGRGPLVRAWVKTDRDGRFAIDGLPDRPLRVGVRADGCLSWQREPIDPNPPEELRIELAAGLVLTGRVVDAATGAPLLRYSLDVRAVDPDLEDLAAPLPAAPPGLSPPREFANGEFIRDGLDAGTYVVEVHADRHAAARSAAIELRPGARAPAIELRLQRGHTLAGVVVDARDGGALAGARVELRRQAAATPPARPTVALQAVDAPDTGPANGALLAVATTGADGAFGFEDLAAATVRLVARRDGFLPHRTAPFRSDGDRSDVRLELQQPASLTGNVEGAADAPGPVQVLVYGGIDRLRTVPVTVDGGYRITDLEPGDYLVRACRGDARDYLLSRIRPLTSDDGRPTTRDVMLHAGELRTLPLRIDEPAFGVIVGTCRIGGMPAVGWHVTVISPPEEPVTTPRFVGRHIATVVAPDGSYRLERVPAGTLALQFASQYTSATTESIVRRVTIAADELRRVDVDG